MGAGTRGVLKVAQIGVQRISRRIELVSYDVSLWIDTGAGNEAEIGWWNMTSNVAPMWRDAGVDLRDLKDVKAADAVGPLGIAAQNLVNDPARYRAMNPENGWGSYDGCLKFIETLRDACRAHPNAVVRVSH